MIPASAIAIIVFLWSFRLRANPQAPRVARFVPLALIVCFAIAWGVTVHGVRVAATGDDAGGLRIARLALGAAGVALLIALGVLTWASLVARRRSRTGPGDYLP